MRRAFGRGAAGRRLQHPERVHARQALRSGGRVLGEAVRAGAGAVARDHVAEAGGQARARAAVAELNERFSVVGFAHDVHAVARPAAEEAFHALPAHAADPHLQLGQERRRRRCVEQIGQRRLRQRKGLEPGTRIAVAQRQLGFRLALGRLGQVAVNIDPDTATDTVTGRVMPEQRQIERAIERGAEKARLRAAAGQIDLLHIHGQRAGGQCDQQRALGKCLRVGATAEEIKRVAGAAASGLRSRPQPEALAQHRMHGHAANVRVAQGSAGLAGRQVVAQLEHGAGAGHAAPGQGLPVDLRHLAFQHPLARRSAAGLRRQVGLDQHQAAGAELRYLAFERQLPWPQLRCCRIALVGVEPADVGHGDFGGPALAVDGDAGGRRVVAEMARRRNQLVGAQRRGGTEQRQPESGAEHARESRQESQAAAKQWAGWRSRRDQGRARRQHRRARR